MSSALPSVPAGSTGGQITPIQTRKSRKIINKNPRSPPDWDDFVASICRPDHTQDFQLEKSKILAFNQNISGELEPEADMFVFDAINPLASHPLIFKADIFRSYYRQERNYDF